MAKIVVKTKDQLKDLLEFAQRNYLFEKDDDLFADSSDEEETASGEEESGGDDLFGGGETDSEDKSDGDKAGSPSGGDTKQKDDAGETAGVDTGKVAMSEPAGDDLKKGNITLDMIVTKLNQLRSGRSLKDKAISAEMEKYFEELDDNERLALYAFLKGITQIITGEISGEKATEPEDTNQIQIKGKAEPGKTKTMTVPLVHKGGPKVAPEKSQPSKEDTTSPAPVQVKPRK